MLLFRSLRVNFIKANFYVRRISYSELALKITSENIKFYHLRYLPVFWVFIWNGASNFQKKLKCIKTLNMICLSLQVFMFVQRRMFMSHKTLVLMRFARRDLVKAIFLNKEKAVKKYFIIILWLVVPSVRWEKTVEFIPHLQNLYRFTRSSSRSRSQHDRTHCC